MWRALLVLAVLSASLSAQDPPWIRLDLVIFRVDLGPSPGIGLHWPRVGVEIAGNGVSVGVVPETPPPPPAQQFAELEAALNEALQRVRDLLGRLASDPSLGTALREAQAEVNRILDEKQRVAQAVLA